MARNRRDDAEITETILARGARLVSVAESIDDTPSGRLQHGIMATFAQFYIDNLKAEVLKGTTSKAQQGGTPYRAPLGYRNRREIIQGIDVRTVEIDEERAPLVTWAFEEYATGQWTLLKLRAALTARGFTTRPSPKRSAKPIAPSGLHRMLTSPYYVGIVPYRGVYHEGSHPPLVETETWLRVQDVLSANNHVGEKEFKHPHYLKVLSSVAAVVVASYSHATRVTVVLTTISSA